MEHYQRDENIPQKALEELREALFSTIGERAMNFSDEDLQEFGMFLLTTVSLAIKISSRQRQEESNK